MHSIIFLSLLLVSSTVLAANSSACFSRRYSELDLKNWREELNCRELKVGEKRFYDKTLFDSPTSVPASYVLTKTAEKKYQVDIALNVHEEGFAGLKSSFGFPPNTTELEMREKIAASTKDSNKILKGPNGEEILLNPVLKKENRNIWHWGLSSLVSVDKNPDFRSHSRAYEKDIDCPAIIHELLHLLGLVDEYQEKWDTHPRAKKGTLKDCRVLGPKNSIMSNHLEAIASLGQDRSQRYVHSVQSCFETAFGDWTNYCQTDEVLSNIEDPKAFLKEHTQTKGYKVGSPVTVSRNLLSKDPQSVSTRLTNFRSEVLISKNVTPKTLKDSVLEPAHFRAIIYPGCEKKNSVYYKCAMLSRKTSWNEDKVFGITISKETDCNVPQECQTGDWLK